MTWDTCQPHGSTRVALAGPNYHADSTKMKAMLAGGPAIGPRPQAPEPGSLNRSPLGFGSSAME